jgi:hypothetical protein
MGEVMVKIIGLNKVRSGKLNGIASEDIISIFSHPVEERVYIFYRHPIKQPNGKKK